MIQESINQILATGAIAARMSPQIEKMNKQRELQKGEKVISDQLSKAQSGAVAYDTKQNPDMNPEISSRQLKNVANIYGSQYENLKKQFELNPSASGYERMASAQTQAVEMRKMANEIVKKKITNSIEQDNDFKELSKKIKSHILIDPKTMKPYKEE